MRLVSYNILHGGLGRADPLAEILQAQRAEVVCLLEADDLAVVQRIARRLGMDYIHGVSRGHAAAILSGLPLRATWNESLRLEDFDATFLLAEIGTSSAGAFAVGAVHLHPQATLADEAKRSGQIEKVLGVMRTLTLPHFLAGDFNANSPIQKIDPAQCKLATQKAWDANGGLLPRTVIAKLLDAGYVDTLQGVKGEAAGEMGTFTTQCPGQRVDFIFAKGIAGELLRDAWIETDRLATFASDHYPVGVEWEQGGFTPG